MKKTLILSAIFALTVSTASFAGQKEALPSVGKANEKAAKGIEKASGNYSNAVSNHAKGKNK